MSQFASPIISILLVFALLSACGDGDNISSGNELTTDISDSSASELGETNPNSPASISLSEISNVDDNKPDC